MSAVVARGFVKSNMWVVNDVPALRGTYIETQKRKKLISDSVSDLIRKNEPEVRGIEQSIINASRSTIYVKSDHPVKTKHSKSTKNARSKVNTKQLATENGVNDLTGVYSLDHVVIAKHVNMQNGKASNVYKSTESKKYSSPNSRFSVQNESFPLGIKAKQHESGQSNCLGCTSPFRRSSFTGRDVLCNKNAPSKSVNQSNNVTYKHTKKVFLSEKQSASMKIDGMDLPCAPPATPTTEQLLQYEYIPSLKDIRAQRAVKQRLEVMEKQEQKREVRRKETLAKLDKQLSKQREIQLKRKQRQEIYALNAEMTALENQRFEEFCQSKGGLF